MPQFPVIFVYNHTELLDLPTIS